MTLELEGIEVRRGERAILRGVSLALRAGEVLTLAGPNGAGKTTLLRVASRVLAPDAGSVRVAGRPVQEYSRRELARQVAVVPQDAPLSFPFSAFELVLMGRAPHLSALGFETRDDLERARRAMDAVGILGLAERSVLELSGGERQLVWVARALAQDARILLLDEPTAHLDLRHRVGVAAQVRAFAAAGGSALVVSHDLGLAARSCDRLGLLREGALHSLGPPEQVLTADALREVFGVEAEVLRSESAGLAVLPRLGPRPPSPLG